MKKNNLIVAWFRSSIFLGILMLSIKCECKKLHTDGDVQSSENSGGTSAPDDEPSKEVPPAKKEDADFCNEILQKLDNNEPVDTKATSVNGFNALHIVAQYRDNPVLIQKLIDQGVDVTQQDENKYMPLHMAIQAGHFNVAEALAKKLGKDATKNQLNQKNKAGNSLLHEIAKVGDLKATNWILDNGGAVDLVASSNSRTPLDEAVDRGYIEMITLLLGNGADVNHIDDTEETPIFGIMLLQNSIPVLDLLNQHKANLNAKNHAGQTLLHLSMERGKTDIFEWLVNKKSVDLNIKNKKGDTPLNYAVQDRLFKVIMNKSKSTQACVEVLHYIRILIERGADIEIKNNANDGPIRLLIDFAEPNPPVLKPHWIAIFDAIKKTNAKLLAELSVEHKENIEKIYH